MIEIKPHINHKSNCPYCGSLLKVNHILWQGMHICVDSICIECNAKIIEDMRVSHALKWNYQVDLDKNLLFGNEDARKWFGEPLLESLKKPQYQQIEITKEVLKKNQRVIILNCIDILYGHSLLKLLNAQIYIEKYPNYGLIIIVPKFLKWMVPDGSAEVWTVDISLKRGQDFYFNFHQFMSSELERFDEVFISEAYSHPSDFDITRFTKISQHNFDSKILNITFIWREDRLWINYLFFRILKKVGLLAVALLLQNWKIRILFNSMRFKLPGAKFTVAGLGKKTRFPGWIEDARVHKFEEETEKQTCKIYSESRLVIGIHGSNMLLPSGHAGLTIDLMPQERWDNLTQDILYQIKDPRLAAFKYRYVPDEIGINDLSHIASSMIFLSHYYKDTYPF